MIRMSSGALASALLLVVSCADEGADRASALDAAPDDASELSDAARRDAAQEDAAVPSSDAGASDASQHQLDAGPPLSGMCTGNYFIQTQADVEQIRGCTSITYLGVKETAEIETLELPNLKSVGTLHLGLNYKSKLTTLNLPALVTVEKDADVSNAPNVVRVDLPALKTVGGSLTLHYTGITAWTAPELTSAGGLSVNTSTDLVSLSFPKLTSTKWLVLDELRVATSVDFPALRTVDGFFSFDHSVKLGSMSFPALTTVAGYFEMRGNQALATVSFPALDKVGESFAITGNPALPTCRVQALRAQLVKGVGTVTITGNDDTASCL